MKSPVTLNRESLAAWQQVYKVLRFAELVAQSANYPNNALLATLIANGSLGHGMLPADLGLGEARFSALTARYFPGAIFESASARIPLEKLPEHEDIVNLLLRYRAGMDESEYDIAVIVATACAGCEHLWQDLGLNDRKELSALFERNFPRLASKNSGDMKWKKFLYKQLCEEDGIYVCRAPSCGACKDYPNCFGPEA